MDRRRSRNSNMGPSTDHTTNAVNNSPDSGGTSSPIAFKMWRPKGIQSSGKNCTGKEMAMHEKSVRMFDMIGRRREYPPVRGRGEVEWDETLGGTRKP